MTIYKKSTSTNLYLLYESDQCRRCQIGLFRTLTIRILLICSTEQIKNGEFKLIRETLKTKGYAAYLINRSRSYCNNDKKS